MIQVLHQTNFSDFDEFINWYPENSVYHYELHNGVVTQMPKPRGQHSQIAGFLIAELSLEIRHLKLPYFIPKECIVKTDNLSGYEPDVIVVSRNSIQNEPRWEKESTLINGQSIKLVIEILSSNWSDDYALKLDAYETMGIEEYWIVDYLGLGGRKFIGYPKSPTFTVNILENGEYKSTQFKDNQLIQSSIFPELKLTVAQIFRAE
ncbi:MAG: Uma2 family endonuclease [Okeania sp. SIO3I5]|uniref:Uma2 family endonuclease n=1 Tax=Okeania sp. SIO3I5 TaxID=2607805 RepID=UPI0013BDC231|nr:Uma2 family endonuclease [Okeania sp. SIO3I5]NEQ38772.1 Uma2 family endonuclease [Okeania sp. SIO3I5]